MMTILSIESWWMAMTTFEKIYWLVALPASVVFLILMIMTFFAGDLDTELDTDGDADAAVNDDHGISFQFVTLKNLVAFFTIFGWTGIACVHSGLSVGLTVGISTVCGLAMMALMSTIYYFMGKLTESGNMNINNAIGKMGTVYLPIPPKKSGTGKVQVKINALRTLDAVTDDEAELPTGAVVTVTDVINEETLVVRKN